MNRGGCLNRRLNGHWCNNRNWSSDLCDGRRNGCRWRWCDAAGYGSCCFSGKVRLAGLTLSFLLGSRCFTHWALLTLALLSAITTRRTVTAIAVTRALLAGLAFGARGQLEACLRSIGRGVELWVHTVSGWGVLLYRGIVAVFVRATMALRASIASFWTAFLAAIVAWLIAL